MNRKYYFNSLSSIFIVFILIISSLKLSAQSNEDCLMCHEDPDLSMIRKGKKISLYVKSNSMHQSVHKEVKCAECHIEADAESFPHSEGEKKMPPVNCGHCHKAEDIEYNQGIHGIGFKRNDPYAPSCKECHGQHDILPRDNPKSRTYKMNIPYLCGNCHKEGSPIARIYNITEHNIVSNYSEGIHGKGLYESGLLVTATCNDCHGNHMVKPSRDKESTVHHDRIASTCMKCHVRIEQTHKKVVKNELWEKRPGAVPACSECHPPHIVQYEKIGESISNRVCLKCHDKSNVAKNPTYKGLKIQAMDIDKLAGSVHYNIQCIKCHSDANPRLERPCETSKMVECASCHIEVSNDYFDSGHGKAFLNKSPDAPHCKDCHGSHETKSHLDESAPTYRAAIPNLCGKCHKPDGQANKHAHLSQVNAFADYSQSIHGKGLVEKGLLVSAICTDCHTSHHEMKASEVSSSVHPSNVPATCGKCHKSIYEEYLKSDHSILKNTDKLTFPVCTNCHSSHTITEIDGDQFQYQVTVQCGSCHEDLSKTYKDTYHGKAYMLGDMRAAKCSDCHGSHYILNINNPNSTLSYKNVVNTCKQCHSNANLAFTGYMTHATHHDNDIMFWSFWLMTSLLVVVFSFFGLHTILWLPKSFKQRMAAFHAMPKGKILYYRRFNRRQRFTHLLVIITFLLLALTGMTLKFAHMEWAAWVANLLGGVKNAGNIHRLAAILTFAYFAFHLNNLVIQKAKEGKKFKDFVFGKNSLMFNLNDIKELKESFKWFIGKGPRPEYGRWTYWEKFDYMAVFWGVAVIGFSGLVLWFPEFFTLIFPGWVINVAQIIHSDEALLATGFIFTIHFFNTHLRPETFPMDTVIFTGHVPLEEYKKDRPREYQELVESGKLKDMIVEKEITPQRLRLIKFFGFLFLGFGIVMVVLIVYSLLFGFY